MMSKLRVFVFLIPLATLLFSLNMGGYDLWPADEPRFGQVAREMIQRSDYLVPHINNRPYQEKPPLLFWMIALVSQPVGDVTAFTARVPSVMSAVGIVVLTYLLVTRMWGPNMALWACLILITTQRFWWQARTAQIDMLLSFFMILALYSLWRWDEDRRNRWLFLFYSAITCGLLAKGPPALVFPLLLVFTFYWREAASRKATHWVLGSLAAIVVTLLWFIPARLLAGATTEAAVEQGMVENLFVNTVGRFVLGVSKLQPPWYYLTTIPVDLLPWTLLLPPALYWLWCHRKDNRAIRFLLCWTIPALIFFSISLGKRSVYILPLFPVFAMLLAPAITAMCTGTRQRWLRGAGVVWCLSLLGIATAPWGLAFTEYSYLFNNGLVLFSIGAFIIALAGAFATYSHAQHFPKHLSFQTMLLLALAVLFVFPVVNEVKSARAICAPVRELASTGHELRLFSVGFSREEYVFYSEHFHEPILIDLLESEEQLVSRDLRTVVQQQRKARRVIIDAVKDVAIENIERITPAERFELRSAIELAIDASETLTEELWDFEHALIVEIDRFAGAFAENSPALMFVQAQDWRWILALHTDMPTYHVVEHRGVGRREVMLLANNAAMALINATENNPI